jgi:predicted HAD superfamily Cof-like phosphohydrolase
MSRSMFHDQQEFLSAGDVEGFTDDAELLAARLMREEYTEWSEELYYYFQDSHDSIKEALDLMYVTAQYLNVTIGADKAKECWDALHKNNMSKCINGKLVKRKDGKVLKPESYKPLNLNDVLGKKVM